MKVNKRFFCFLDSEDEEREEEERWPEVTSMDQALRTVTDTADVGPGDSLTQNYETPEESCSSGKRRGG